MSRASLLSLCCLALLACSSPEARRQALHQEVMQGPVGDRKISVQPFSAPLSAARCPSQFNGAALAARLVDSLRKRGAPADLATDAPPDTPTLVVNGAITMCSTQGEGGEGFAYGAGGKVFDGEKEVGEFRAYHLCEYGLWTMGVEGRGDTCLGWVADVIASTIVEGNFAEETAAAIEAEQRAYGIELASEQQAEALRRAQSMIITAGPISQQYAIQGPIDFDTIGYVNYGSVLHDALFVSPMERAVRGPTPTANINQAFNGLRYKAAMRYPDANAVINATYVVDKNGTVFANGLAVQVTGAPGAMPQVPPAQRATDDRLRAAKALLDQGLITQKEYEAKRAEILHDL